jgi:hypothetical protein
MQEFFLSWGWVVLKAPEKTCFGQNIDGLGFQNVVQQVVLGISATLEEVLQSFSPRAILTPLLIPGNRVARPALSEL